MGLRRLGVGLLLALGVSGNNVLEQGTCAPETVTVYITGPPTPSVGATSAPPLMPQEQPTTSEVVVTAVGSTVTSFLTLVSEAASSTAEAGQSSLGTSLPVASIFPTGSAPADSPSTTTVYASVVVSTATVEPLPTSSPDVLSEASDGQPQDTQSASPTIGTQTIPEIPAGTTYTTLIPTGTMGMSYTGPDTGAGAGTGFATTSTETSEITSEISITVASPSTTDSFNSTSAIAAASTASVGTPITPVTESMPSLASMPADTSTPSSMSMSMPMNDTSLPATSTSVDLGGASSSLLTYPASGIASVTSTSMSMDNISLAPTQSCTDLGESSSILMYPNSGISSYTNTPVTMPISDNLSTAALASTSFSLSTSLVPYPTSVIITDTASSSDPVNSTALPVSYTFSTTVESYTSISDFPFTTEPSVNSSAGLQPTSAASTTPVASASVSDSGTTISDFPLPTGPSVNGSSGIQSAATTSVIPSISASAPNADTSILTSLTNGPNLPLSLTSDQPSLGDTSSTQSTLVVTSVSVSIPTDTLSEPTVSPESSGLLPGDPASSSSLGSDPQQPISAVTDSSILPSAGSQKGSSGEERISRTWAMSSIAGITHAAATPLQSSGAQIGKRQVGAIVYATIDGALVSWTNTYSPTPANDAMISSMASMVSPNMSTTAALLSETDVPTALSESTDGQPENTQPASITPASSPAGVTGLLSEYSDGQPENTQAASSSPAPLPTDISTVLSETSSDGQPESTQSASDTLVSYPTGIPTTASETSSSQLGSTQSSSSTSLVSYPTSGSPASSTSTSPLSPVSSASTPTSFTASFSASSSTVSNTPPPYSFSPSWNTTTGSTTLLTISGTPVLSPPTVASTTQLGTGASSAPQVTCTGRESSDFSIGFDELPHYAAADNHTTNLALLGEPYYHLMWADGWSYVPKPIEPFLPSSPPQLGIFNVNASVIPHWKNTTTAKPLPDQIWGSMFGAGPNYLNSSYWIDVDSAALGCENPGPDDCEWSANGWTVDPGTTKITLTATHSFITPPCPGLTNCSLTSIPFPSTFSNLVAMELVAQLPTTGENVTYFMDDLKGFWSDKSCLATHVRQTQGIVTPA
ncbi:hypothetical protein MMC10_001360 [Thelotrema lepadinum]|nr:hypothetical protein [Thelotrema lepadinum]